MILFICVFTLHPAHRLPGFFPAPFSSERIGALLGIFSILALQVSAVLGASSPTEARLGIQLAEHAPQAGNNFWDRLCSVCSGPMRRSQMYIYETECYSANKHQVVMNFAGFEVL